MNPKNKWSLVFFASVMAVFVLACSAGLQKANGLVDEANKLIDEAKPLSEDAVKKYNSVNDKIDASFPENRDSFKADAQDAADNFDKASKKLKDASGKFDEASKQSVTDKFKEYLTIKSNEFSKRSDILATQKDSAQAFLDAKDIGSLKTRVDGNDAKVASLGKEATDLGDKAKKIETDNPDMFKK